jgi:hypothetical protein
MIPLRFKRSPHPEEPRSSRGVSSAFVASQLRRDDIGLPSRSPQGEGWFETALKKRLLTMRCTSLDRAKPAAG